METGMRNGRGLGQTGTGQNSTDVGQTTDDRRPGGSLKGVTRVTVPESAAAWLARLQTELPEGPKKEAVLRRAKHVPSRYFSIFAKSHLGAASMRARAKSHCYGCVAYDSIAENVGKCTSYACEFWDVRPHQPKEPTK